MRRDYYRSDVVNDAYTTVADLEVCAKQRSAVQHKRCVQLLPTNGPLELLAVEILGPHLRTDQGNQYSVVITDPYSKLTSVIPTAEAAKTHIATIIFDNYIITDRSPELLLIDNGSQFVAKIFQQLCCELKIEHLTTTACHPQARGQEDRYNKKLVASFRHYIADHYGTEISICSYSLTPTAPRRIDRYKAAP